MSELVVCDGDHDSRWGFIWNLLVVISLAISGDMLPGLTRGMQSLTQVFQEALLWVGNLSETM